MSLEIVMFKKCYKEKDTEVKSNQVLYSVPEAWTVCGNELVDTIRELYKKGETKGYLPTDDEGIRIMWEVRPYKSDHEITIRGIELKAM